jgi:Ni/Fe-hydrogenase subunit HybB-like protein
MSGIVHRPLGGRVLTKPVLILSVFAMIGLYFIARRFLFGLGDVSHMSNGYPLAAAAMPWPCWCTSSTAMPITR